MTKLLHIFIDIFVSFMIVTLALFLSVYIVDNIIYSLSEGVFYLFEDSHVEEKVLIHSVFSGVGIVLYQIFLKKECISFVVGSVFIITIFYYYKIYFQTLGLDVFLIAMLTFSMGLFLFLFIAKWMIQKNTR